jgi:hypothetical protein
MPLDHPFAFLTDEAALHAKAKESLVTAETAGAAAYRRAIHLPRLLPLMPKEIADESPAARRAILARLARALRQERRRGRAGHWTYDLNRHIALRQAYLAERALLSRGPAADATRPPPGSGSGLSK